MVRPSTYALLGFHGCDTVFARLRARKSGGIMSFRGRFGLGLEIIALVAVYTSAWAFQDAYLGRRRGGQQLQVGAAAAPVAEYAFTRVTYRAIGANWYYRFAAWATDYPQADRHFIMGVKRLSLIETSDREVAIAWNDPRLFQYPILYAVEVGYMELSDEDVGRLREYLLRGGFLIVDDFHGPYEWARFEHEIRKVFPDRPILEVDINDPVFHCFYDINEKMQVPGVQYLYSGSMSEKGGVTPHYRGIYDDKGRLMVMINYNFDLGDAWEHADMPEYPEKWSSQAYRLGINYIIYSMTH